MRYLLVAEGSDDRMLFGPIEWLLDVHCSVPYRGEWANPAVLENPSRDLPTRLAQVKRFFPCDLAFVHRDVDTFTYDDRASEINRAIASADYSVPVICTIPVRMTEAWFLFNEAAIKQAADRPSSRAQLRLPSHAEVQRRADPKDILTRALIEASDLSGRRLRQFSNDISRRKMLVSNLISDYSPLRAHQSFTKFEADLKQILQANSWAAQM
ncbi:MAG TPA: hypothetical protein VFB32_11435 [Rudaea sp.]|nr:hypothetical protein [Rudaea sp.]